MRSAPTIAFEWRPSRAWRALRWTILALGAACLLWSNLDAIAKMGLSLFVAWMEWRTQRSEKQWSASHWQLRGSDEWKFRRADHVEGEAVLTQATVLGPLLVLNLRDVGHRRIDLPIWPDQLDADTRRRLRVRLR